MEDYSKVVNFLEDNRQYLTHDDFDGLFESFISFDFCFGKVIDFFLDQLKINILDYFSTLYPHMFIDSKSPEFDFSRNTKITEIPDDCFRNLRNLTSVKLPPNLTRIGDYSFSYCSKLTNITIPPGVTSIGDYAFDGCSSLNSITIPESVTSIGEGVFNNCSHDLVIHAEQGSYAEEYAKDNKMKFVTI